MLFLEIIEKYLKFFCSKSSYACSFLIGIDYHLQAIVVFVISIHAYAYDKSEMEEVSMVALSGCIWLQAFVVTMETK